jgi:hypothetical protein
MRNTRALDAAAIERQVNHLAADLGHSATILVLQKKDPPSARIV